ncbi:MAG: UbiA family prenyltransferase [Cyclobacteriaceae bacterium]|jgi:4-hydroxybenzoate polyprenyltransferase|nr:UbiA family prenyltransferase [Cyclobacteriaceae bacterium]|tara:strand:- start:1067 stop:1945 length:879 start_codon:yes stop_codon:yes gene_type:complete
MSLIAHSTLKHLRITFSFNLLPIFLFALAITPKSINWIDALVLFVCWHFFIYPASNGFNSYFDKDKESIAGIKYPPKVTKELYYFSIALDGIGILLALCIHLTTAISMLIYGLISKAYSHPLIRLKKRPVVSWIIVSVFQGYFVFLVTYWAIHDIPISRLTTSMIQIPALLTTMMLMSAYPITQVYQHKEDRERGDFTLSLRLGVLGTFHFTALGFVITALGYVSYFFYYHDSQTMLLYLILMIPLLIYYIFWYQKVIKSIDLADFEHTMKLNRLSALCLNAFFLLLIIFNA